MARCRSIDASERIDLSPLDAVPCAEKNEQRGAIAAKGRAGQSARASSIESFGDGLNGVVVQGWPIGP
jgi:hypothetical protein